MLIIAEEIAGEALTALLSKTKAGGPAVVAVHPPEYGKWRKGLIEDIAIITGGRVLTRELGATVDDVTVSDMGTAGQIRVTSDNTYITGGNGNAAQIKGRRDHVRRQIELTEVMVDRDKLEARLAKLSGGIAIIRAGGVTPADASDASSSSKMPSMPPVQPWKMALSPVVERLWCKMLRLWMISSNRYPAVRNPARKLFARL